MRTSISIVMVCQTVFELIARKIANCPDVVPSNSSLKRVFEIFKEKSKYQIDLPTEETTDVVDLLHRMWTLSPTERTTAKDLLEHKWFQSLAV